MKEQDPTQQPGHNLVRYSHHRISLFLSLSPDTSVPRFLAFPILFLPSFLFPQNHLPPAASPLSLREFSFSLLFYVLVGAWFLPVVWRLENSLKAVCVCVELESPEFVGRMPLLSCWA